MSSTRRIFIIALPRFMRRSSIVFPKPLRHIRRYWIWKLRISLLWMHLSVCTLRPRIGTSSFRIIDVRSARHRKLLNAFFSMSTLPMFIVRSLRIPRMPLTAMSRLVRKIPAMQKFWMNSKDCIAKRSATMISLKFCRRRSLVPKVLDATRASVRRSSRWRSC